MASGFERAHREQLLGALTTVDRLIVHGHLSRLGFPNHMAYLLDRLGVHIVRDRALAERVIRTDLSVQSAKEWRAQSESRRTSA